MPKVGREPKRQTSLDTLEPYVADRVRQVLAGMKARGFDPIVHEARRTQERQQWLYGIGRTHHLNRKPVTWVHDSKHIPGKAVDIISKSKGYGDMAFFRALVKEGKKVGLYSLSSIGDWAHLEWRG